MKLFDHVRISTSFEGQEIQGFEICILGPDYDPDEAEHEGCTASYSIDVEEYDVDNIRERIRGVFQIMWC